MLTHALKAFPLAILLAFPAAAAAPSTGEDSPEKSKSVSKTVVVTDDGVYTSGDDDDIVIHGLPGDGMRRGYMGVRLLEMTPELREHFGAPRDEGVLVASVESDSPAAKAGIQVGDIITRVGGEKVESSGDVSRAVRRGRAGDTLAVEVSRDRAKRQFSVKVEERRVRELDLGNLGRDLERSLGKDFGQAWVWRNPETYDRLQKRLEELDKRLKDLEKKFAK